MITTTITITITIIIIIITSLSVTRKNASGSYLKELYVTSDRFKNETN